MKILSLDTAMAACSAAVVDTGRPAPLAEAFAAMDRGHAEALPPMVAEVMQRAGLSYAQLDRIAVTIGPGSFTGVRIGLSFARGLGLALGIPVVGIDSLSAIAANEAAELDLLVACEARNGEVYAAVFDGGRRLVVPPCLVTMEAAAQLLPEGGLALGTAARLLLDAGGNRIASLSAAVGLPVAARFAKLAEALPAAKMPGPLYLRAPDATPSSAPLRQLGALVISPAGHEACGVLAELHGEAFDDGWTQQDFSELLNTPGTMSLLALHAGEPVGFLLTRSAADEAEIITIGTRPAMQRRGVGRQLLEHHLATLGEAGVRQLFLEVAASNVAALTLYGALGFRDVGRRKAYYRRHGEAEDAILMRREISG